MPIQIYRKFHLKKTEKFQIKKYSDIFCSSAQNRDCGYSLEPPCQQSMFLSRNKKNNIYPCKPQIYYIKVRFKGVKIIKACFRDVSEQFRKLINLYKRIGYSLDIRRHTACLIINPIILDG